MNMHLLIFTAALMLAIPAHAFDPCMAVRHNVTVVKQTSIRDQAKDIAVGEGLPYYSIEFTDRVDGIVANPPADILARARSAESDAVVAAETCRKAAAGGR